MNGKEFLDGAKNLARSQFEASLRSAISRAYYALLNVAIQFLTELGFSVEHGPGAHGQAYRRLFNCGVEPMNKFARTLDELRTLRNQADYNMKSTDFKDQATSVLRVAKAATAIDLFNDSNKEPLRSQIRAGIREYERQMTS